MRRSFALSSCCAITATRGGRANVESYGSAPVIVYEPEDGRHGNFFDAAYNAIAANPDWMRRFDKDSRSGGACVAKTENRSRAALARTRFIHEL